MDFFARQERSRKKTVLLVSLFVLGVIVIILSVHVVVTVAFYSSCAYLNLPNLSLRAFFFQPKLVMWSAVATLAVIAAGCIIKTKSLAQGGQIIAASLGGRLVSPATTDPDRRRLLNVVEEMALASGIPVPQVFVLEREKGINAFAAGYDPSEAVVAVTQGCLKLLSRDELQGVIAHEYSHILNGDMRLNIRLMGWLGGFMAVGMAGRFISFGYLAYDDDEDRRIVTAGFPLFSFFLCGLGLLAVGYGGLLLGRTIQCAVSRQREFLADASAVQFTRNPPGLAGALKKIGGCLDGSLIKDPAAMEISHMFFGSAMKSVLSTHPSLGQRIRLLDPGFKGEYEKVVLWNLPRMNLPVEAFAEGAPGGLLQADPRIAVNLETVAQRVGAVSPENVFHGRDLLAGIPKKLREEASHPLGAIAVVCGILLDRDSAKRKVQIELWRSAASGLYLREILKVAPEIQKVDVRYLLPLVDLAFPALRQLSPRQYESLLSWMKILVEADNQASFFEFAVQEVVKRRLDAVLKIKKEKTPRADSGRLQGDMIRLFSLLAHAGHREVSVARQAFAAAAAKVPNTMSKDDILPVEEVSLEGMGRCLDNLSRVSLKSKKNIFEVCAQCVFFDEIVTVEEAELLRVIAYALGLPLPPFLPQAN